MRQGRWVVVLLVFALCGCTSFVARKIERPGHDNRADLAKVPADVEAGRFPVRCREHATRCTHGLLVRPAERV